jgi:hypothetical protein
MIKRKWLLWAILPLISFACNTNGANELDKILFLQNLPQSNYNVDITEMRWTAHADSIYLPFRIVDRRSNEKDFWGELSTNEISIINDNIAIEAVRALTTGERIIPDNILVSLLIDRSINPEDIPSVQAAVKHFVDNLPENTVYISFFDDRIGESRRITSQTFDSFNSEFVAVPGRKAIFNAALLKFKELSGENILSVDDNFALKAQNDSIKKYLVLLTDGRVNANDANTSDEVQAFTESIVSIDSDSNNRNLIEIHAIRYGEENPIIDSNLSYLSRDIRRNDMKGGFYAAEPESIIDRLTEISDRMAPDYEMLLVNKLPGRIYAGENRALFIQIEKDGKRAMGVRRYVIGTPANPIVTGAESIQQRVFLGVGGGVIILLIAFFIIQIVIPFLVFKMSNFDKKYVITYQSEGEDRVERCSSCLDDLLDGESVVVRCRHKMHRYCWVENGYKCAEYGQNCKDGKQFYFDKDNPFSSVNSPYFMKWALFGLLGGLVSWVVYQLVIFHNPFLFETITTKLLNVFYFGDPDNLQMADYLLSYISKVGPLLLVGLLLGFILTALFAFVNEYRRKSIGVLGEIFLRSIIGSLFGFISFLIGSIIIIVCKANGNNVWIDWIPWLLFGGSLGLCLAYKTTIAWKHALLGGIISGLLSFIILFSSTWFGSYAVLFSFMLYSAGLGISIVTVHYVAQKYFLKYTEGTKTGEIAIHKWMSMSGGSNDVTIGKSKDCIIQMNWDNNAVVKDVHAKLFIDKKTKIPYLKALEENLMHNGNAVRKDNEIPLKNGLSFKIGNTEFQYIEKS